MAASERDSTPNQGRAKKLPKRLNQLASGVLSTGTCNVESINGHHRPQPVMHGMGAVRGRVAAQGSVPLENGYSVQRRVAITLRGSPQYTPL